MILHIKDGQITMIYDERLNLSRLGKLTIQRASYVEPDPDGHWSTDLSPSNGPVMRSFSKRSEALAAECSWLEKHLFKLSVQGGAG